MPKKKIRPELSIVIPAYNESLRLDKLIPEIANSLRKIEIPYEIIVVDDGSTDLTDEIAREQGAIVISHRRNLGKGAALQTAFKHSQGDIVVTIDPGGAHDPREIEKLINPISKSDADLVIGTRFSKDSNIRPHAISWQRRFLNLLFNVVFSLIVGVRISDSQSGFRAYRRKTLENLELKYQDYETETEIIFKSIRAGSELREVPITSRTRIRRYTPSLRDGFLILRMSFALRLLK